MHSTPVLLQWTREIRKLQQCMGITPLPVSAVSMDHMDRQYGAAQSGPTAAIVHRI